MAKVDDATTASGPDADWFKVTEMGLPSSSPDYWATEVLNDNCGHFAFTVPSNIAPGNYLVRAEVIGTPFCFDWWTRRLMLGCSPPRRQQPRRRAILHVVLPGERRRLRHC